MGAVPAAITTDVFVIPLLDRYLVYAPLRRAAFVTSAAAVNLLYRLRQGKVYPANEQEAGFLQFCRSIHLLGQDGDWPISTLDCATFRPSEVTLFLTTRCNLRCIYCYASAGDRPPAEMSLMTARRGIEFVCRNALELGRPAFGVGYHGGGEPTVHWEVLTESFAYAQRLAQEYGLKVYGSMATNGVLSPKQQQWVIQNFRGVNLSVDGLPAVQDMQRPKPSGKGSSAAVLRTCQAFDRAGFSYGMRVTVTAASAEHLPRSVEYLLTHARPKHIQVEPMYVLGRGGNTGLAVEPQAFVEAFLQAKKIADQCGVDLLYSAARMDVLTNRYCQGCGEGFSLTPQGLVSACYDVPDAGFAFGEQFIIGSFEERGGRYVFDQDKLAYLRGYTVERIPWCQDCFCKWHCAGDCAYKARHTVVDGQFVGDSTRCEITRALTLEQILEKIQLSGGTVWAENVQRVVSESL
jgi:uncharacterized protein